jgi:outer membrane protein assembly factor BamB
MLRALGAVLILLALLAPTVGVARAQDADNGMTGVNSYRSPHFGYEVEWQSSWRPRAADAKPTLDRLVLGAPFGGPTQVAFFGLPAQGDANSLVASIIGQRQGTYSGAKVVEQDTTGSVPSATLEYDDQGQSIREYVEVREVGPGESFVAIDLRTAVEQFEDNLRLAQSGISFDGGPLFIGANAPPLTPTPAPSPTSTPTPEPESNVEGTTYTSPNFGFSISWDAGAADVVDEAVTDDQHDYLILSLVGTGHAGTVLLVEGYEGYQGDPAACVQASTTAALEDGEDVKPAIDATGDPIAGQTDAAAFAAYSYQDGGEPTRQAVYVECRTLIPGKAIIAFTLLSGDSAALAEDMTAARDVIATLTIPGADSATPTEQATTDEIGKGRIGAVTPEPTETTASASAVLMARANPARTGEMPGPGPDSEPGIAWSFATEEDIYSSPAVVDGVVYFGGNDGRLYAIDASTGLERWHFQTEGHQISSPAVVDGVAFIGSDDDQVYAVDTATGEETWRFDAGSYVYSSPVVADGVVYAGSGTGLYAIDAKTGQAIWHFQDDDVVSFEDPAVAGGMVYVGGDEFLFAIDAASGQEQWRFETKGDIPDAPAIADGIIYLGTEDGGFSAIDAETGQEQWHVDTGEIQVAAAIAQGVVYIGDSAFLYAIDAETGKENWRAEVEDGMYYSSPTVADGAVFAADDDFLHAFDAETGDELWQVPTDSTLTSDPVVVDGVIYVGDRGGTFHAMSSGAGVQSTVMTPGPMNKTATATATVAPTRVPDAVTPEPAPNGAAYESPHYGYRLVYDPNQWQVSVEDTNPSDPFDTVTLSNDAGYVYLVGDPNFGPNQLRACVDTYHTAMAQVTGVSDVQPRSGETISEPGRVASAVEYLYTPASGQSYRAVDYVECRSLPGITLVIQQEAPVQGYESQAAAREALLMGLEPPQET